VIVSGESMTPTYENGELIVIKKISPQKKEWAPYRYGVYTIYSKKRGFFEESLVKRVVGLPGDTIRISGGFIYLNEKKLQDPFGKGKIRVFLVDENDNNLKYWNGPEAGGAAVELVNQKGEEIPEGHVWVIGDNRSDSWFGLLPIGNIKGRVLY
jgi:signal peptidase I